MRLAAILAFVTVVCGVAYFVFSHPSLERLDQLEREAGQLATQNEAMADRNAELERQIVALRDDPRLAERRARETAGLARPEELIFQFEEPDKQVRVRVRLRVSEDGMQLAGRPVELAGLSASLEVLREEMPHAELTVRVDDEVGPIERQRVVDIVEASPMGPGSWEDDG